MKRLFFFLISFYVLTLYSKLPARSFADEANMRGDNYVMPLDELSDNAIEYIIDQAKAALRMIAIAAEAYKIEHKGMYPAGETALTNASPAYLTYSYCGREVDHYNFECTFSVGGYEFVARPAYDDKMPSFKIITGQILTQLE